MKTPNTITGNKKSSAFIRLSMLIEGIIHFLFVELAQRSTDFVMNSESLTVRRILGPTRLLEKLKLNLTFILVMK